MPAPVDSFELFSGEDHCKAVLPANVVRDTFTIVGLAALVEAPRLQPVPERWAGPPRPVVIPRDVINPIWVEHLREIAFRGMPEEYWRPLIKGGLPLLPSWEEYSPPPPPPYADERIVTTAEIDDLGSFFTSPSVRIAGTPIRPELTRDNVRDLLEWGETVVIAAGGDRERLVRLVAERPQPAEVETPEGTVEIHDIHEFLRDPRVVTNSGTSARVSLTSDTVGALLSGQPTRLTIGSGSTRRTILARHREATPPSLPEEFGGAVATARSRSMASHGPMVLAISLVNAPSMQAIDQFIATHFPRFDLVLYMPYRQTWELLGYSRGELLNSFSLAPQEETTIEIYTWDRMRHETEAVLGIEREGTLDIAFTDKDTTETVKEMTKASDWKLNLKGDITIPIEGVPLRLGGGLDASQSFKALDRTTNQSISEATRKAAARIKTTRQTKVVDAREVGTETRVSRKLKNENMCRTLNLDYFEVLASYEVSSQLDVDEVRLCVLTPTSLASIMDRDFVIAHEGALSDALLSKAYLDGLKAVKLLAAWERYCFVKCAPPCPCDAPKEVSPPVTDSTTAASPAQTRTDSGLAAIRTAARAMRDAIDRLRGASPEALCALAGDIGREIKYTLPAKAGGMTAAERAAYEEERRVAMLAYHRWLYREVVLETFTSRFWAAAIEFANAADDSPARLERLLMNATPQVIDFLNPILLLSTPAARGRATDLIQQVLGNACWNIFKLVENIGFNDAELHPAIRQARSALEAYKKALADASKGNATPPAEEQKGEQQDVLETGEEPEFPPRDLADALVAEQGLLAHLKLNESYYREAIWRRMDPADRIRFLSVIGNIPQLVENNVLGFVGDKALMPVRLDHTPELQEWFRQNFLENEDLGEAAEPFTVTLPTKGVTLEARLGACDGCEEFIMEHRAHDLAQKAAEVKMAEARANQEELETARYQNRLDGGLIDAFKPQVGEAALRITLVKDED